MLEKLNAIKQQYEELSRQLEEAGEDYLRAVELAKERSELEEIVSNANAYFDLLHKVNEAHAVLDSNDMELKELAEIELSELIPQVERHEKELRAILLPKDPRDHRNVIIEIRAGTGGDEAALFAADLFRLYNRYAERRGWSVEILSQNEIGIGGLKEIVFSLKGKSAYSRMKFESGVHRVQRIPSTESSGRIHTSTITVAVLAEVEDVDIKIPDSDIKLDVFKSAGAGGQNVQKNMTAVRITHIPSGMVVACQDERSLLQNRLRAMSILRARLYEMEMEKIQSEHDANRRSQVGTGERSEKIRTYNYPQSRVTDHRINVSSYNLASVMEGDLDIFVDELSMQEESDRLAMIGTENGNT